MLQSPSSLARVFKPRKPKPRVLKRPVITVKRRDGGEHHIAPSDSLVTLFQTRDGAEWLEDFLGAA